MIGRSTDALRVKLLQVLFGLAMLFAALSAMSATLRSGGSRMHLLGAIIIGCGLVLWLNDRYWFLAIALPPMVSKVPGLPFDGYELACLSLVAPYCLRLALHRSGTIRLDRDLLITFPLMMWIAAIFISNPVGMNIIGSATIGGRFYFQIAVAFMAMLVLSSLRLTEKDAKQMFWLMVVANAYPALRRLGVGSATALSNPVMDNAVEAASHYELIGFFTLYGFLFARYSLSQVLRSPRLLLLASVLAAIATATGKRRVFASIALFPIIRAFLTKKDRVLTLFVCILGLFFTGLVVVGDGVAYRLPRSAKRALAVVFDKYRRQGFEGVHDTFRENVRREARAVIRAHPWVGRKGFAMNLGDTLWILGGRGRTNLYGGHAYAGNWHSTWYAFAADFGLPCLVFFAMFYFYLIRYAIRGARLVTEGTYLPICCLWYSTSVLIGFVFSYTSGHSATSLLGLFVHYGWLMAIVRGYQEERRGLVE